MNSRYTHQNELDKACSQHGMVYRDFKGLPRVTASHKILHDKEFNIRENSKYDGYQRGLDSMVYRFFDKKVCDSGVRSEIIRNQELEEEIHKPIIRKFEKRKIYSSFIENIWGADLANKQLISKFNKRI